MEATVTSKKIVGTVSSDGSLKGSVGALFAKDGDSAYQIALNNGFKGTEAEWLASLKGDPGVAGADGKDGKDGSAGKDGADGYTPIKGRDYFDAIYIGEGAMPDGYNAQIDPDGDAYTIEDLVIAVAQYIGDAAAPSRIVNVTLTASKWNGADSLYSQVVTIDGITEYSKVDLLPSVEQLAIFHNKDVTFVTENEDGVVTVYAIGDKPTQNYTMQAQITEVAV